ncbi:hypothetical protein KO507_02390 [Gilvimarinus agarilyticus]|uniref:hypothetical protein n=1 Tax=Gilvimarinus sp. 2_MG-2023 TaxID=3062666 RepID=UPI001C08F24D|nr:hypothetical protein [Gilvimarinus sp. 2_MG-2023]MBU2884608.1 hypothetical protein [Gilvimarinus agarilyticus]MDO6569717.1 hypothetical protein [Gilvimarinus sp. 2_MG-2023]
MWDFNLGAAVGLMRKTLPFLLMRLVVYVGITLAYMLVTGIGAGIGYGLTSVGDGQGGGAFMGGRHWFWSGQCGSLLCS